jgi:hypothetical protein
MAALKAVLTKAEVDALPEALRGLYAEKNGKFVLDAEIEGHPDVAGLKSALEKERTAGTTTAAEFRKLKEQIGDMDPVKARDALDKIQKMAEKKLIDEGQFDELMRVRTEAMTRDHGTQVEAFKKQIGEKDTTIKQRRTGELKELKLNGAIRQTWPSRKASSRSMIEDVVARFTHIGVDGVRWDLDGGAIVAKRGDAIAYGKDASEAHVARRGLRGAADEDPRLLPAVDRRRRAEQRSRRRPRTART